MKLDDILKLLPFEISPTVLALGALAIAGGVVAYKWLQKQLAARKAAKEGEVAAAPKVEPPKMAPKKLSRVWKRFLDELPPVFRRSILNFQPFVILGASGSGKSALISSYTDWQRQSRQFLGSATDDPDLQIYLGSRVLAFEVAPNILHETSSAARKALIKLFSPVLRGRPPIVVVVLDLIALQQMSPDAARNLADTIRGKLSLLSWITKKPVELRLALTHLEGIEGFPELSKFFERRQITSALRFDASQLTGAQAFQDRLLAEVNDLDRLLPLALTTLESAEYVKVVAFLREAPRYLPKLGTFLAALCAADALSKRPQLERIYLTSEVREETVTNPFHAAPDTSIGRTRGPLFKHQVIAASITALGIAYLLTGYILEHRQWEKARGAALEYSASSPTENERKLRRQLTQFTHREEREPFLEFFPSFFGRAEEETKAGLSDSIRRRLLLRGLEQSFVADHPHAQSLYYLALLYARPDNELGHMINPSLSDKALTATVGQAYEEGRDKRARLDEWAAATGLDRELIRDYVESTPGFNERVSLLGLPDRIEPGPTNSAQPWHLLLRQLKEAMTQPFITADEHADMERQARALLAALAVIHKYRHTPELLRALEAETGYDFEEIYRPALPELEFPKMFGAGGTGSDTEALGRLLQMVASPQPRIAPPDVIPTRLAELCAMLELILQPPEKESREAFVVHVGNETYAFGAKDFSILARNSAARELLLAFVHRGEARDGSVFFDENEHFEPISMNSRNDGTYLFTRKASLDGHYTRVAFEKNVRPVLVAISLLVERIPLHPDERTLVDGFLRQEVETYAAAYVKAIDDYYGAFEVRADTAETVSVLLKQMRRPESPFENLLNVVFVNTKLDIDEKVALLTPLREALEKYEPIQVLMTPDKDGKRPELTKYEDTLEQMDTALTGVQGAAKDKKPAAAKAEEGKKAEAPAKAGAAAGGAEALVPPGLAEVITPAGRMSLAILKAEPESYREIVSTWLSSARLYGELGQPFLAPVEELYAVGLHDIEAKVGEIWTTQMLTSLSHVKIRFPFDLEATEDVSPKEMEEMFHPATGKFHDLERRFILPISNLMEKNGVQTVSPIRGLRVPQEIYEVIGKVDRLTRELWDADGKPKPLRLEIASVPFDASSDGKWYLTLVYLESGSATLVNFNQQPLPKGFELDWTALTRARIGVELSNIETANKIYPTPLVARASYWSFLHLLSRGEAVGTTWSWRIPYGKGREPAVTVRFNITTDPRTLFAIFPRPKLATREAPQSLP